MMRVMRVMRSSSRKLSTTIIINTAATTTTTTTTTTATTRRRRRRPIIVHPTATSTTATAAASRCASCGSFSNNNNKAAAAASSDRCCCCCCCWNHHNHHEAAAAAVVAGNHHHRRRSNNNNNHNKNNIWKQQQRRRAPGGCGFSTTTTSSSSSSSNGKNNNSAGGECNNNNNNNKDGDDDDHDFDPWSRSSRQHCISNNNHRNPQQQPIRSSFRNHSNNNRNHKQSSLRIWVAADRLLAQPRWSALDGARCMDLLQRCGKLRYGSLTVAQVRVQLDLLYRLVQLAAQLPADSDEGQPLHAYLSNARHHKRVLNHWKEASAMQQQHANNNDNTTPSDGGGDDPRHGLRLLPSALEMKAWLERLAATASCDSSPSQSSQSQSQSPSPFRYDAAALNMVLRVLVAETTAAVATPGGRAQQQAAAVAAEQFVRDWERQCDDDQKQCDDQKQQHQKKCPHNDDKENENDSISLGLRPDVYTYSQLLQAWAASGRGDDAARQLDAVWRRMRRRGVPPDSVAGGILLRYHGGRGDASKMESVWREMRNDWNIPPTAAVTAQVVHGYCQAGQIGAAQDALREFVVDVVSIENDHDRDSNNRRLNNRDRQLLGESAQTIVQAYRSALLLKKDKDNGGDGFDSNSSSANASPTTTTTTTTITTPREQTLRDAASFAQWISARGGILGPKSIDSIQNALSDILAQSSQKALSNDDNDGESSSVDRAFDQTCGGNVDDNNNDIFMSRLDYSFRHRVWMKIYALNGRPDRASDLLRQQLLQDDDDDDDDGGGEGRAASATPPPGIAVWNSVLDAWAEAAPANDAAVGEAYALLDLLQNDPRCLRADVRPNVATYGCLLKCLATARNSSNAGERAETLLDEMEERGGVRPNVVTFTLAIRACYHSGDRGRAKRILERMERSDSPPTTRVYNSILQHFAQMGSSLAAQRVEAILSHMQDMAAGAASSGKNNNLDRNNHHRRSLLKPDVYSYNILLNAWAKAKDDSPISVSERVWKILQQMKAHGVAADMVTYNQAIALLAKSHRRRDVRRAETLLQRLISGGGGGGNPKLQANIRHYFNVARGWLRLGHLQDAARVMMLQANNNNTVSSMAEGNFGSATEDDGHGLSQQQQQQQQRHSPNSTPNDNKTDDFDAAVLQWVQAGDLPQATALLLEQQQRSSHRQNRIAAGPSRQTYERLLEAWEQQQSSSSSSTKHHDPHRQAAIDKLKRQMASVAAAEEDEEEKEAPLLHEKDPGESPVTS